MLPMIWLFRGPWRSLKRGSSKGGRQVSLRANLKLYWEIMRKQGQNGLPMRPRLFLFLILFLNAIMLGVLLILFLTGVFAGGHYEHRLVLENELRHIAKNIEQEFLVISVQAVDLAKELSLSIEANLARSKLTVDSLQKNPQLLENLLTGEIQHLTNALERSRTSGVFLMLNATVNPALPGADSSRACVYLKNMEPNIANKMSAHLSYAIGPMGIARTYPMRVLPQWNMELDVANLPEFFEVMNAATGSILPLSRLYVWSESLAVLRGSERSVLCMVPLVGSDGTVFGLCGFEVSEMLFKLTYYPNTEKYDNLFCLFAPLRGEALRLSGALFAGHFAAGPGAPAPLDVEVSSVRGGFRQFQQPEKGSFIGLLSTVALYPPDSIYTEEVWSVALMMPRYELEILTSQKNRFLTLGFLVLMLVSISFAFLISHRYIRPVVAGLEQLKKLGPSEQIQTPEINDLFHLHGAQDQATTLQKSPANLLQNHSSLYAEFKKNIGTLSAAEKRVFDLYVQGHTGQEIAEILHLSINTIKTHSRHIYEKLNVNSRNELMVYIRLMEEAGPA